MSNKKYKQNKTNKEKLSNKQKRKFGIIGFTCLIILLIFMLIVFLSFNTKKSDSKKLMNSFNNYYNSKEERVVLYYDSKQEDQKEIKMETSYLNQLSSDYDFDYLKIDASKLSNKNQKNIEDKLGISTKYPSVAILKNGRVIGVSEGFIESHNLTNLLINTNILPKDAKYKYISNLKFIDYKEYKKVIKENKKNIVVIGQSACQYCNSAKPILNNISRAYDVDIYYVDVNDYSNDNIKELFNKLPDMGYDDETLTNDGSFSMPTLLIIKKNKILGYVQGEKSLEDYIKFLKELKTIE